MKIKLSRDLHGKTWGKWTFDWKHLTLDFDTNWLPSPNNEPRYWIPLDRATTSAQILDWLCQLRTKSFITNQDIGDLLTAFDSLANLQGVICSFGIERGPIVWVKEAKGS